MPISTICRAVGPKYTGGKREWCRCRLRCMVVRVCRAVEVVVKSIQCCFEDDGGDD